MITINGVSYEGSNIQIRNGVITVDGKKVEGGTGDIIIKGHIAGDVNSDRSINVEGIIQGSVTAGGSVNCDNVGGSVNAGGSINCDDIGGNATAGGSIRRN